MESVIKALFEFEKNVPLKFLPISILKGLKFIIFISTHRHIFIWAADRNVNTCTGIHIFII